MKRDQGIAVLRAVVERGEHFDIAVLHEAVRVAADPSIAVDDNSPPRGHDPAPPGCVWERPAQGWIDLRRVA